MSLSVLHCRLHDVYPPTDAVYVAVDSSRASQLVSFIVQNDVVQSEPLAAWVQDVTCVDCGRAQCGEEVAFKYMHENGLKT